LRVDTSGKSFLVSSPVPVQTSPFAIRLRISKAGVVSRFALQGELVFGAGAKTLDSFASLDLRLKERAIILLEIDISRYWIGVVRPCAINEPLDRDDGGHVGHAGQSIAAVRRERAVRRQITHVIAVEMRG
jgi:hypothetical protein